MQKNRLTKRLLFDQGDMVKIYRLISDIDAVNKNWQINKRVSPQMISRLKTSVLITSTGSSTRIEGSKLSDEEVEELYNKLRIKKFKTRDEQEVAGYLEMLQKVFNSWSKINFSENVIKGFHKEIMKYSEKDRYHKGNYKFGSNRVEAVDAQGKVVGVIFDPTPPHLVDKEMSELVAWTKENLNNNQYHPLLVIANFIFEFLAIHPFRDGNGRVSRILTNFLLLKSGYEFIPYVSHEKIVEENKTDYYLALNKTQKTWKTKKENILPWIYFFLKMLSKQADLTLELVNQENIESLLSEKQLLVWNFALTSKDFQRADVIKATGLKPRTVEESIKKLLQMKKIQKLGQGRATRYRVVMNNGA